MRLPIEISTFQPSRPLMSLTASCASRSSANSMNANPCKSIRGSQHGAKHGGATRARCARALSKPPAHARSRARTHRRLARDPGVDDVTKLGEHAAELILADGIVLGQVAHVHLGHHLRGACARACEEEGIRERDGVSCPRAQHMRGPQQLLGAPAPARRACASVALKHARPAVCASARGGWPPARPRAAPRRVAPRQRRGSTLLVGRVASLCPAHAPTPPPSLPSDTPGAPLPPHAAPRRRSAPNTPPLLRPRFTVSLSPRAAPRLPRSLLRFNLCRTAPRPHTRAPPSGDSFGFPATYVRTRRRKEETEKAPQKCGSTPRRRRRTRHQNAPSARRTLAPVLRGWAGQIFHRASRNATGRGGYSGRQAVLRIGIISWACDEQRTCGGSDWRSRLGGRSGDRSMERARPRRKKKRAREGPLRGEVGSGRRVRGGRRVRAPRWRGRVHWGTDRCDGRRHRLAKQQQQQGCANPNSAAARAPPRHAGGCEGGGGPHRAGARGVGGRAAGGEREGRQAKWEPRRGRA